MTTTTLFEAVQGIAEHKLNQLLTCDLGQVTSVFPHAAESDFDNYECNVQIAGRDGELRRVPVATPHVGSACIPNVGDLVVVAFIRGDIQQPVIIGRLYNDVDRPPPNKPNEIIRRLPLHAGDSQAIKVELRKGDGFPPREVLVELSPLVKVRLVDYEISARAGATRLTLTQIDKGKSRVTLAAGESELTINQDGDVSLEVGKTKLAFNPDDSVTVEAGKSRLTINKDGDVQVESEGALKLKASGDLALTGANISLKSEQAIAIEAGTEASLKAGSSAKLEASATMDIKGAMINLN